MELQQLAKVLREVGERSVPESLDLWPSIYQRLQVQRKRRLMARYPKTVSRWRWVGGGVAVALVVVLALAFTPVGVWAQQVVLRYFGITFLSGVMPRWEESQAASATITYFSSEAEAQKTAGFPLRWPMTFPFDRERAAFSGGVIRRDGGVWINSLYADTQHRYLEVQVFWKQRPGPWPVGDARFKTISVAGHEALWGEGVPRSVLVGTVTSFKHASPGGAESETGDETRIPTMETINVLLWEDGETLYVLVDPEQQFSLEDLLLIAESAY